MITLTFLGTSSMVPTPDRNHSALLLEFLGEGILIDCGESTQKQLKIAKIKPGKIRKILISHLHGDHVLGLPGFMQTLSATGYENKLHIFGPNGISDFIKNLYVTFDFDNKLDYEVHEIQSGVFFENDRYSLRAVELDHSVKTIGFRFVEKDRRKIKMSNVKSLGLDEGPLLGKLQEGETVIFKGKTIRPADVSYIVEGKTIGFITDTKFCDGCNDIADSADILVSEATFANVHAEKAREYMHLTSRQAAEIANNNGVKELILTHFSQRYKSVDEVCDDAKAIFEDTVCAYDFMKKKI